MVSVELASEAPRTSMSDTFGWHGRAALVLRLAVEDTAAAELFSLELAAEDGRTSVFEFHSGRGGYWRFELVLRLAEEDDAARELF